MDNPFSWEELSTLPRGDDVFSPFAIAFVVVFSIGFIASTFLYNNGARRFVDHPVTLRALHRAGSIAMIVFGLGLFFFGIRALQINPFSFGVPFWLWLCIIAAIAIAVYFMIYARTAYPRQVRAYDDRRVKQQYLRPGKAGGRRAGPDAAPKGSGQRENRQRRARS
jgi:hypothetical protein